MLFLIQNAGKNTNSVIKILNSIKEFQINWENFPIQFKPSPSQLKKIPTQLKKSPTPAPVVHRCIFLHERKLILHRILLGATGKLGGRQFA